MYYFNILKQEFSSAKTYGLKLLEYRAVVDRHWQRCHLAAKFGVFVGDNHSKHPPLCWLHKHHRRPHKLHFMAKSNLI